MADQYAIPKSTNMLSHLTNAQALKDYKYENARKLVKKQEELLRNLAKVRTEMEQEESQIGKTKDYYAGSRKDKFKHTLNLADNLRHQRFVDKEIEDIVKAASEEAKLPISYTPSSLQSKTFDRIGDVGPRQKDIYGVSDVNHRQKETYGLSDGGHRKQSEIQKLKYQVENIANRYRPETDETDISKYNLYEPEYYPGAVYVKGVTPLEENQEYVSGSELAQYFPVPRYVLH